MSESFTLPKLNIEIQKDQLEFITYTELLEFKLAPGHIVFYPKLGRPKLLLAAGESVFNSLVQDMYQKGISKFQIYKIANTEVFKKISTDLTHMREENNFEVVQEGREEYLDFFRDIYWNAKNDGSHLDLILALKIVNF